MIIYHTTFHVDEDIWAESLNYLKQFYIPKAIESGLLSRPVMQQVLQEEEAGGSLCVQFRVNDRETLHRWMQHEGVELQRRLTDRFGTKIAGFATLLDEIDLG